MSQMCYVIDRIAVVKRGRWFSFRRNEVTSVIGIDQARSWMLGKTPVKFIAAGGGAEDAAQRNMLALADVEYMVTAEVRLTNRAEPPRDTIAKYVGEIRRRAAKGKCFHRPALGCREFAADFDWVEETARVQLDKNWPEEDLGLMLYDVFDHPLRQAATNDQRHVKPGAVFFKAKVKDAVLDCHPDRVELVRPKAKEVG